jgi:hypothetical protein
LVIHIGLKVFGKNWLVIKQYIPTRCCEQIRSRAQKFFNKARKQGMKVEVKPKRKKTFGIMKSADVYAQERKDISNIEGSSI